VITVLAAAECAVLTRFASFVPTAYRTAILEARTCQRYFADFSTFPWTIWLKFGHAVGLTLPRRVR
jgi:hypothetical protein